MNILKSCKFVFAYVKIRSSPSHIRSSIPWRPPLAEILDPRLVCVCGRGGGHGSSHSFTSECEKGSNESFRLSKSNRYACLSSLDAEYRQTFARGRLPVQQCTRGSHSPAVGPRKTSHSSLESAQSALRRLSRRPEILSASRTGARVP